MKEPVITLVENTSHEALRLKNKELPSDTHLVRYLLNGEVKVEGIRAFKMVDIFDHLHSQGATVYEITQGYGSIKPKLYTPPK